MKGLEKKVIVVTGGGSGIGRSIAKRLSAEGADVVIIGRREEALKETASQDAHISYVVADVCNSKDIAHALMVIKEKYGRLDGLVNNAGIAPVSPIETLDLTVFDKVFSLNVRAVLDFIHQALPMLEESKGCIVNITSGLVNNPTPTNCIYTASKAAVHSITRTLAKELAPKQIRVNCVASGAVRTALYDNLGLSDDEQKEYEATVASFIPLGRYGEPEEIAGVVAFLISDDAKYATGAQYAMDGGFGI